MLISRAIDKNRLKSVGFFTSFNFY
jgi:hypothetical protein